MTGARYPLASLVADYPPLTPDAGRDRAHVEVEDFEPLTADDLGLDAFDPIRSVIDHPAGDDRSRNALRCAGDMMRDGRFTDAQIVGVLMHEANAVSAHTFDQQDPRRAALRVLSKVRGDVPSRGQIEPLPLIEGSAWAGVEVPERRWMLLDYIPQGFMTYLTAQGGGGKSLLGQQLAAAIATDRRFLNIAVQEAPALYITAEDDQDELHRRQLWINNALGVGWSDLNHLRLASLASATGNELVVFDQHGRARLTGRYESLRQTLLDTGTRFVVLDNVPHFFVGNENIRGEVTSFCRTLNRLARDIDGAVLLIGHPNKAGEAFSGSTAWENVVRSRLFLEVANPEPGQVADPDLRTLTRAKSNYAANGEQITFRWYRGAFRLPSDIPEGEMLVASVEARMQEERFLACLDARNAQQRPVSDSRNAGTYAPRVFASMPEAGGLREAAFAGAMERLFSRAVIERGKLDFERPGTRGHKAEGIRRTNRGGDDEEPM